MLSEKMQVGTRVAPAANTGQLRIGLRAELAAEIVRLIVECAQAAIRVRDQFTLAIPGGSVADACLPLLMVADLPWEKVHLFWVDERVVPLSDVNSNAGQAFRLWNGTHMGNTAHFHVMFGDQPSQQTISAVGNGPDSNGVTSSHIRRDNGFGNSTDNRSDSGSAIDAANEMHAAAKFYAAQLQSIAGVPIALDVVLLGVGEDGHVASLFPGHASALQNTPPVIAVFDSPKPPVNRLSLAFGVLVSAREVIVAAFGNGKAGVMQQALEEAASPLPVARIIREAQGVHVLLDHEAASQLRPA